MSSTASNSLKEFDEFYVNKLKPKLFDVYEREPECIRQVIARFRHMVDYNVPHGKKLRGLCAYESLLHLIGMDRSVSIDPSESSTHNNNENEYINAKLKDYDLNRLVDEAKAIGWCIEFVSVHCSNVYIRILMILY